MVRLSYPTPNLLLTKNFLPVARSKLVQRDRLLRLLAEGNQRPVTLITAPPGYGKTTLLSQWIASFDDKEKQVAWVSLDEFDNEPARFWGYICEGLSRISSAIEKALIGIRKRDVAPVDCPLITILINEVSRLNFPINLVLDDYHCIDNFKIHQAVEFFIYHLPPNFKVVISSRVEPPLSLARLRASEKVMDIQMIDLQFYFDETNTYLNQVMGLGLATEDVRQLSNLTWGWIAGLQFAAVSIRGQQDIESLLTGIQSGNRYILDYLFEEVFNRQDDQTKNFLLRTSILDKFNASLCDVVCGYTNSKNILDTIYRANLFISVLDESEEWYRYHPLFSSLLQHELSTRNPEIIPELHQRASAWYGEYGLVEQAINHSLVIGDHDSIENLLQDHFFMFTNLLLWGDHLLLRRWLEKLPNDVIENNPSFIILTLWRYLFQCQFDELNSLLLTIQKILDNQNLGIYRVDNLSMEIHLKIIQACSLMLQGEYTQSIELAEKTMEKVDENSLFYRCSLLWALGEAYHRLGKAEKAYALFSETVTLSDLAGGTLYSPGCTFEMGRIQVIHGNLNRARQLFEKGLDRYGNVNKTEWHPVLAGILYIGIGRLHIEWNQIELAEHNITRGISLIGSQSPINWILEAQIALAILKQARGEFEESFEILTRISHICSTTVVPKEVGTQIYIELCKLSLTWGDIEQAKRYVKVAEGKIQPGDVYYSIILQILLIKICMREKKWDGLLENLDLQFSRAVDVGFGSLSLEIMVLKAIYWKMVGEPSLAHDMILKALSLAQPEGYIYSIIKDSEINDILENVYQNLNIQHKKSDLGDPFENYIQEILDASRKQGKSPTTSPDVFFDRRDCLVERLTNREIEILRLAAQGADRNEISQNLHISMNTMKTHLRNIYGKFAVHNLSEAVAFAYQRKLL